MMPLQDNFDVADLLGHPAFGHLANACEVYRKVHESRLSNPLDHKWQDCLGHGMRLLALRRDELEACVHSIVLFQAFMEKVPYFVPDFGSGLLVAKASYFADSWNELIAQIDDENEKARAQAAFDSYKVDVYTKMRNPIIHGRKPADIDMVNQIRVPELHTGMMAGWRAYDYLLTQAFKNDQTHNLSWARMCESNGVPVTLDLPFYPDLEKLSIEFTKRFQDGVNS